MDISWVKTSVDLTSAFGKNLLKKTEREAFKTVNFIKKVPMKLPKSPLRELYPFGLWSGATMASSNFALILAEIVSDQKIIIVLEEADALMISLILEGIKPSQTLTHDLLVSLIKSSKNQVQRVCIDRYEEGIFLSRIDFIDADGKDLSLDCKTTDAIILALKLNLPIFTTESILSEIGITLPSEEVQESKEMDGKDPIAHLSTERLNSMLLEAEKREDYRMAARLQDEMNRREKENGISR